jgi:Skp family chaperone for outer membrane proteins
MARALHTAQRRIGSSIDPRLVLDRAAVSSTPRDDRAANDPFAGPAREARPAAAAIGSIDLEAVFKRAENVVARHKELETLRSTRTNQVMKMESDVQDEIALLSKFVPDSEDYKKHEIRATDLKARFQAARDQMNHELDRRQSESAASLYKEIQDTVGALAKAKGLTYIVKVAPSPGPSSKHSEVLSALNNSVVYADPKNDLTEEVIAALNRQFTSGTAKAGR